MEEIKQPEETFKIKKATIWQITTFLFLGLFVISLFTGGFGIKKGDTITGGTVAGNDNLAGDTQPQPQGEFKIKADDPKIGPDSAKVKVIEYSDFQCPYCGAAFGTQETLVSRFKASDPSWEAAVPKLEELAKAGKIQFIYKDYPLTSIHPNAMPAALAANCAHEQGKFWEYHDNLFKNQEALEADNLKKYAADLKLDTKKFNDCFDSKKYQSAIQQDMTEGNADGVSGTPAFFVNGRLLSGAQPFSAFEPLLKV
ncbi:MAG TPA: DsbA family protein [Candidatus Nanoarchaeia archaeon]|nr:DsbA family protein [Candidatus Nanoarchaeia archaeon]